MAPKAKNGTRGQETRAHRLLATVVAAGEIDLDELARELVVTRNVLDAFVAGRVGIPLERQLCLALFVIQRIPSLARQGHQLKGQVAGALAFQEREKERERWRVGREIRPPESESVANG